ncbi:SRPBCC domain-containing protein [Streptomyces sp. NPDC005808]|uniref:SRPBCC domain-containing protein n=1 Tax=Streptomyces sp. NPDC005808 TaxID=3364734 RepID=UPI00367E3ECE
MDRTDRADRVIAASPATVYGALIDRESLETWLPPEGMRGRIERWDPRPGGGFRMALTYLDPAGCFSLRGPAAPPPPAPVPAHPPSRSCGSRS